MKPLLSLALGVSFVALGIGAIVAPRTSARVYGAPSDDPSALAWVRACGARDIILASLLLHSRKDPALIARTVRWCAMVGVADGAVLAALRGPQPNHFIHLGGAAVLFYLASRP